MSRKELSKYFNRDIVRVIQQYLLPPKNISKLFLYELHAKHSRINHVFCLACNQDLFFKYNFYHVYITHPVHCSHCSRDVKMVKTELYEILRMLKYQKTSRKTSLKKSRKKPNQSFGTGVLSSTSLTYLSISIGIIFIGYKYL